MKTCVIANPNAGSAADLSGLATGLLTLGEYTLRLTRGRDDAERFAREALRDGYELIVAAGGDGTASAVANGLAEDFAAACFGLIPLGTGNDFARTLSIPTDTRAAVEVLKAGRTRAVDVVRVHGPQVRHFINVAGAGFTAEVGENVSSTTKSVMGGVAYVWAAAKTLSSLTEYRVTVTIDDSERIETAIYNLLIANARYVGGGIPIAPEAEPDDGRIDLVIVPVMPKASLLGIVPQILAGSHVGHPELIFRRAQRLEIRSSPAAPFNLDGEAIGEADLAFEALPRVLRIVAPA